MGMGRIKKDGVGLMRKIDVGDVTPAPGEKPWVFATRNRLSNAETHAGISPPATRPPLSRGRLPNPTLRRRLGHRDRSAGDDPQLPSFRERAREVELAGDIIKPLRVVAVGGAEAILQVERRRRLIIKRRLDGGGLGLVL